MSIPLELVRDNARRVLDRAREAAVRSGRSGDAVTVVAASKTNGRDAIRAAYEGGIRTFGENRVQELTEKRAQGAYEDAGIQLLGRLQKNKVKYVAGQVELIHSVDSPELMEAISKRALSLGRVQDILIEVNIAAEEQKGGVPPERLEEILARAGENPGIRVAGLMTIPPAAAEKRENFRFFENMARLFVDMATKKYDNVIMQIMSMGMSRDFEDAILAGATLVRVGTAIFGPRDYGRTEDK